MRKPRWTEHDLKIATSNSRSIRQILIRLGLKEAGGNYSQIKYYLDFYQINHTHLTGKGWSKGRKDLVKKLLPLDKILIANSTYQSYKLKNRLIKEKLKDENCEKCGWSERSIDGRIPLELDHINGVHNDNRLENLRILCPNCHSLEPTHRGKNKKTGSVVEWQTRST